MSGFKVGDLVQLKSGGPLMVIRSIDSDGDVYCEWFDSKQELKGNSFVPQQLESQ